MKQLILSMKLAVVITCVLGGISRGDAQAVITQSIANGVGDDSDLKKSIAFNTQYLHDHPDAYKVYNNRGNAELALDDLDEAISDFNETIRLNASYVFAYNGRGNACSQKGSDDDLDQAVTDFSTAIRLDPKYAHAYNGRGLAELSQDGIKAAIADFTEAIALNPSYKHAFYNRAVAEYVSNQPDLATADLNKAIELDPTDLETLKYLWIVTSHTDQAGANQKLKDYLQAYSCDAWGSAEIHFLLGDLAQDDFLKQAVNAGAAEYRGDQCQAYFLIASKAEIAGDKVNAIAAYRHCLETGKRAFTDYIAAKAKIHQQDHPETAGVGQLAAVWVTGQIFQDGVLMFKTDRPVKDNPLGNVVLLGATLKPMLEIFAAAAEKSPSPKVRLYGYFLHSDLKIPGHNGPVPNVEFRSWKMHAPDDPDVLPPDKRILIDQDSSIPGFKIQPSK